jgi:Ras-related protein Rab-9A
MLLKVVLIGDGGVGKSSLMNRFVHNSFDAQSFHTIGVEFVNKEVVVGTATFTLQVWDTAGQERFRSLRTPFYRGSDCCLLVFSVDDRKSFRSLKQWKDEFIQYADVQNVAAFPFVVVGNKSDVAKRDVSYDEAHQWCLANGDMPYFETSAKDAINVERAFIAAVERVPSAEAAMPRMQTDSVNLKDTPKQGGGCC